MLNADPQCLFCRWVAEGRARKVLGSAAAFPDGHPVTPGHLLIVPMRHTPDCLSMTAGELRDCMALIAGLTEAMRRDDPAVSGFNIGANAGASAGQTIFHAHIHLIPRRNGDCKDPRGGVRGVIDGKRGY